MCAGYEVYAGSEVCAGCEVCGGNATGVKRQAVRFASARAMIPAFAEWAPVSELVDYPTLYTIDDWKVQNHFGIYQSDSVLGRVGFGFGCDRVR